MKDFTGEARALLDREHVSAAAVERVAKALDHAWVEAYLTGHTEGWNAGIEEAAVLIDLTLPRRSREAHPTDELVAAVRALKTPHDGSVAGDNPCPSCRANSKAGKPRCAEHARPDMQSTALKTKVTP